MFDLFGIMVSSIIMLLVIVRAMQLDAVLPWFKEPKSGLDSSGLRVGPDSLPPAEPPAARDNAEPPPLPGRWRRSKPRS